MSAALKDLLFTMRQHPAFEELLSSVDAAPVQAYKSSQPVMEQQAEWIFRSGRQRQDKIWRDFLTEQVPQDGEDNEERQ